MSLRHGILGLLSYSFMGGYDLVKTFRDSLAYFWAAQTSQIYRELDGMRRAGWVRESGKIQRGRTTKTLFELTEAGRVELLRWLGEPAQRRAGERNLFLLRFFLQGRAGTQAVHAQLTEVEARARAAGDKLRDVAAQAAQKYGARAKPLDNFCWRSTLEYGIAHYEMQARWARERLAELGALAGEARPSAAARKGKNR